MIEYKPHLKTQEGVSQVALNLCEIVEKHLKTNAMTLTEADFLFDDIYEYINNLAGNPDLNYE